MLQQKQFDNRPVAKRKKRLNVLPDNPDQEEGERAVAMGRFPSWLHRQLPKGSALWKTGRVLTQNRLPTVCEEAQCPNLLECWSKKSATFLIMGKECTRACGFCDIDFSKSPQPLEADEPARVAASVKALGLTHVVITMVARDDIADQGASHIAAVIAAVKAEGCSVEVLTSDFNGDIAALNVVLAAEPEIFNHNIETVEELTPRVRHTATYRRTLGLLAHAAGHCRFVKSGLMVGLGETQEQVLAALHDLKNAGVTIVTIGQYLQPNRNKLRVKEFITPDQFDVYASCGRSIGIPHMYCGPFVRSSYNAKALFDSL